MPGPSGGRSVPTLDTSVPAASDADGVHWFEDNRVSPAVGRPRATTLPPAANTRRAAARGPRPSKALRLFNSASSGAKAARKLVAEGLLGGGGAQELADFIFDNDGKLDQEMVGDLLSGSKEELGGQALPLVMGSIAFEALPLDSALRLMIASIKLPGEAQKIDRIIEAFAARYVACNPGLVAHPDDAYVLAFSLTLLNTDAHNANIRKDRKMTQEGYVRNLRGVCKDGSSPDEGMLCGFYQRVTRCEWAVEEREHMRHVKEGWVTDAPRRQSVGSRGGKAQRKYAIMSTRALYFYTNEGEAEP
jgi:hypothetical protein